MTINNKNNKINIYILFLIKNKLYKILNILFLFENKNNKLFLIKFFLEIS